MHRAFRFNGSGDTGARSASGLGSISQRRAHGGVALLDSTDHAPGQLHCTVHSAPGTPSAESAANCSLRHNVPGINTKRFSGSKALRQGDGPATEGRLPCTPLAGVLLGQVRGLQSDGAAGSIQQLDPIDEASDIHGEPDTRIALSAFGGRVRIWKHLEEHSAASEDLGVQMAVHHLDLRGLIQTSLVHDHELLESVLPQGRAHLPGTTGDLHELVP
mmetsp:Transcript_89592/g.256685  ORF Transcript_89592/g.256685 Transcript_89592/m.256685 type:complete len:217 (-) Transcript_89592:882-1532(-)